MGFAFDFLSVSGVWIWLKKRRKKPACRQGRKPSRKSVKKSNHQNGALNRREGKTKKPKVKTSVSEKVGEGGVNEI